MSITTNLTTILNQIPKHVTLVAVSKTKPVSDILEAYNAGHKVFGENKVQDMVDKYHQLPKDIKWHMIGHVQRNKVKYMASFVHLIHGVDSLKLLQEINKQAQKHNRIINCLLQVKIATEDSKYGMSIQQVEDIITSKNYTELQYIKIVGLMGMATFTNNQQQIQHEFLTLKQTFISLKSHQGSHCDLNIISMGMSGDYQLAIDCGSTMVRIGSLIFGKRQYAVNSIGANAQNIKRTTY